MKGLFLRFINSLRFNEYKKQSKETYGQTRGLTNLEMKHVGKLAVVGALLKVKQAVFVPWKVALILHSIGFLGAWPLLHTYYKIASAVEFQLNMEW